jgi:peptide/nickel transport system substrate-binding protein
VLAQAMMQAVGINAQIEVLEWATQLDRYNSGNYQMSSFSYSSRLDPALSYEQFSGPKDKQARKVWEDPQALKLIDDSFAESDPKKRQALFDQIHALMIQQVPMVMLFNGLDAWAVRKRISGFAVWEGKPRMWGVSAAAARS